MAARLVIVGAGGHGREVLDIVEACGGFEVIGFVDDGSPDGSLLSRRGYSLLGDTSDLVGLDGASILLGIGDARVRAEVAARLPNPIAAAAVHPLASIGTGCTIGAGTVVAAGARLTTNIQVGQNCYIGPNATVGHDTILADFATLYPGAVVSGEVRIGRAATVGAAASVKQGLTIGSRAIVGMGAAATHDVPEATTVTGVPARRLGAR